MRAEARSTLENATKNAKKNLLSNRRHICHAIAHAWHSATLKDVPGRKTDSAGEHYGEFPEFIKAALEVTGETNDMNIDQIHKDILALQAMEQ